MIDNLPNYLRIKFYFCIIALENRKKKNNNKQQENWEIGDNVCQTLFP